MMLLYDGHSLYWHCWMNLFCVFFFFEEFVVSLVLRMFWEWLRLPFVMSSFVALRQSGGPWALRQDSLWLDLNVKGFVNFIVTCIQWWIDSDFDAIVQFCSCPTLRWCASAKGRFLSYIVDLALMASSFLGEITSWENYIWENHLTLSESNAV